MWIAVPVWVLDLSVTDGGLISGGQTGQWEWGGPSDGPVGLGAAWGTNLDGPYLHDTVDWLEVQLPDLTGVVEPVLILHHWYAIRAGDQALVQADGGAGFVPLIPSYGYPAVDGFVGRSPGYTDHVFDLEGLGPAPRIRLQLTADAMFTDAGWYVQRLGVWDGDILPPVISLVQAPADTQDLDGPYPIEVDIADDRGVTGTTLWIQANDEEPIPIPMAPIGGSRWAAEIGGQPLGAVVHWWVETTDGENAARWPAIGTESFRIYLAAPTGLTGPLDTGRLVATEVELTWDPPSSPNPVLGYQVHRAGQLFPVAEVELPEATVPLTDGSQSFWVRARYEAGLGDPSEVLDLGIEVPQITVLEPSTVYQGEELHLRIEGRSLYLLVGRVTLDLGPGIAIDRIEVRDAHALVAHAEVDPEAGVGLSDVTLGGTAGTFVFQERFEIRRGTDAPRIRRIAPAAIVQGDEVEVELDATVPFAAIPVIGTDEDLLVTSEVAVDETTARFSVAVSNRARLGLHSLSIDDGERLYTIDLQIEEYVARIEDRCEGCATGPDLGVGSAAAGVALLRRRRRRLSRR